MARLKISIFLLVLVFLLPQCQVAQRLALLNCKYRFLNVAPSRIGWTSLDLKVSIQVDNPNPMDVVLDRLGFDFFVNGSKVGSGDLREGKTIPAGGSIILEPVLKISYLRAGISVIKAIKNNQANYELRGRATYLVGGREFVFPVKIVSGEITR